MFLLSVISEGIHVPRQVLNTHRCVWSVTTVAQLKSYILHLQLQQDERRINWRYAARKNIKSFDLPIRHDRIICVTANCSGDEEQRIRTHTDCCVLSFIWLVLMFPLGLFGSVSLHMTDSWAHWFGLRSSFLHGDVFFLMHQESRGRSIQRSSAPCQCDESCRLRIFSGKNLVQFWRALSFFRGGYCSSPEHKRRSLVKKTALQTRGRRLMLGDVQPHLYAAARLPGAALLLKLRLQLGTAALQISISIPPLYQLWCPAYKDK